MSIFIYIITFLIQKQLLKQTTITENKIIFIMNLSVLQYVNNYLLIN